VSKIRLSTDDIKHITLFESLTGAKVKDFLNEGESMSFLVNMGEMGLAIGKKGANVEKVRKALGKNILVFEYNEDEEQFLKNMFAPVEVHGLSIAKTSGGTSAVVEISREDRSRAIGAGGSRIKVIKTLAKRHCDIDDLNLRAV
jgi:transcription termination/antitermination protein NusA